MGSEDENNKSNFTEELSYTTSSIDGSVKIRAENQENEKYETVHDLLHWSVKTFSSRHSLASWCETNQIWTYWTYQQYYDECCNFAKSCIKVGLAKHHAVCILGINSPHWIFANIGAILAGGVGCGIYTTNMPEACYYALEKSCANVVVVANQKQLKKILKVWDRLPQLKAIVQYSGNLEEKREGVFSWEEFLLLGKEIKEDNLQEIINSQKVNQCCQIIFTSGTTGNPKGVLLSHDNITSTARCMLSWTKCKNEILLSYLPLSHVAAQILDIWLSLAAGNTVYFPNSDVLKGGLVQALKQVQPTTFFAVPRVWEKIQEKLKSYYAQRNFCQRKMVDFFMSVGYKHVVGKSNGSLSKPILYSIADHLFFKQIRRGLGLERCWLLISSAAPLSSETQGYLWRHDLPVIEMYGASESCGPHCGCLESPFLFKFQSVGKNIQGRKTKVNDSTQEICAWGRNVMMGYLGMPELTNKTIDKEGWLHTGDVGRFESEFLYLTGRIKDLIITAGGENIPPTVIENRVKEQIPICVVDNSRGLPTANLSPNSVAFCRGLGSTSDTVTQISSGMDKRVTEAITESIGKVNSLAASRAQQIRKWVLLPSDFTIQGGELGPTLKVRRNVIVEKYKEVITAVYEDSPEELTGILPIYTVQTT